MTERVEVRNAADPQQVKRAARRERRAEDRQRRWVWTVMSSPEGRAFVWSLLERAGVFGSIYHPSSQIYYLAGRQDFGHELMAEVLAADEELYLRMEQEARERARFDARATEAGHTASAEEKSDG